MSSKEQGASLVEALVVVAIIAAAVTVAGTLGLTWMQQQRLTGATYGVYVQMNLARVEAANRNRPCQVLIDTGTRQVRVMDLNNVSNPSDDEQIVQITLDSSVAFALPDGTTPITLDANSGTEFEAIFDQDGTLISSTGVVALQSGDRYSRVSVYAGGGVAAERWDGAAWVTGS